LNDEDYEMEDMEGISDDKNESNANDEGTWSICERIIIQKKYFAHCCFHLVEDPFERFTDNSCFPTNKVAIVFFFMLISLHGRYLTDEGLEVVMMYLNIVLDIFGDTKYRFPKYARTFVGWCQLSAVVHKGIQTYVCCTKCKAIHPYETDTDKYNLKRQRLCLNPGIFPNSIPCQNSLFKRNAGNNTQLKPISYFYYNSMIQTLKTFMLREDFFQHTQAWKTRPKQDGRLIDVADGRVFQTFKAYEADAKPFVESNEIALMCTLGLDWFQVYTYSSYSCGKYNDDTNNFDDSA